VHPKGGVRRSSNRTLAAASFLDRIGFQTQAKRGLPSKVRTEFARPVLEMSSSQAQAPFFINLPATGELML
jgi:hypothetical protein